MSNVVITGCFDIIHVGHVRLLNFAKSLLKEKDILIILIDSDERVKARKGNDRPINNEKDRREVINSIVCPKILYTYTSNEELLSRLSYYNNHIRICGEEYKNKEVLGKEYAAGVVYFNQQENYSTTNIINHAQNITNR